ncbi:MAG: PfkB family carbohydrate kinase [Armatimonadota bacterium]|nr:PfkB family carbohydrate kinase [Armatimonadota bacterium]
MSKPPVVAAAGICCLDYIVTSPRVQWGDTAWVTDFRAQGGGLAATAMVACARLGADCSLLSLLGDDQVGDVILSELAAEGVRTDGVVRVSGGQSPLSFIHVDEATGERTIFHKKGASLGGAPPAEATLLSDVQALLIDDIYPALAMDAARLAHELGVPVVADLAFSSGSSDILRQVDVFIASRHYAREIGFGDAPESALDEIHRLGPKTAVITLGADGYVWSDDAGRGVGEAFRVDVVDTTSAGDAFHGAFCYGLACGWETARCCEFAAAVAAIKCTRPGGRTGLPSLDQTIAFLQGRSKLDW